MNQTGQTRTYDLEERSFLFAEKVNAYVRKLPKDIPNIENGKQLSRSSGSVAANYIEANEALSKKDFLMRAKISKKECKESRLWLRLTKPGEDYETEKAILIQESTELMKILGAIIEKSK
jgi:four helix bundle protein